MSQAQDEFDPPILTLPALVESLREMQLNVSEDDILHPTQRRVCHLYECLLRILVPWRVAEMDTFKSAFIAAREDKELRDDITNTAAVFAQMYTSKAPRRVLAEIGYHNFVMEDTLNPTPDRTSRVLCAIVNYAKFMQDAWKTFEPYAMGADEVLDEVERLKHENEQLANTLTEDEKEVVNEGPEVQRLKEETAALEATLRDLRDNSASVQRELTACKEERRALVDILVKTMNRLSERCKEMQETLAQVGKSYDALKQMAERMDIIKSDIDICLQEMHNVKEVMSKAARLEKDSLNWSEDEKKLRETILALKAKQDKIRRALSLLETKIAMAEEQRAKKREAYDLRLSKNTKELDQVYTEEANRKLLEPKLASIEALEKKVEELTLAHNNGMARLSQVFLDLERRCNDILKRGEKAMNNT
ncbi:kinetochore-associated Ndc80 complex subunit nuf2 [Apophysomyces ossiformis]|uniref:Kinetochore-associated Ndc80 complex subunit nuf2 n=1 Tax=Apophysomyces ossiformis TaxID=679940 RepID=A0A8H7BQL5_9FUNG|nr:kinetochore-associated Ndc80 complex subunit nuf2 [Apophysomyces ossiformis]